MTIVCLLCPLCQGYQPNSLHVAARYVIDDGNSTRPANSSELAEHLGIEECEDPECTKEKEHL